MEEYEVQFRCSADAAAEVERTSERGGIAGCQGAGAGGEARSIQPR